MAAFSTFTACEQRAYAKTLDKTWVNAFADRKVDGTLAVRVQRYLSSTSDATRQQGEWVDITDDATV